MKIPLLACLSLLAAACGAEAPAPCDDAGAPNEAAAADVAPAPGDDAATEAAPDDAASCLSCHVPGAPGLVDTCTHTIYPACVSCAVCGGASCAACPDGGAADASPE